MGQGTLLFRASLGDVLRAERMRQGRTLRELSGAARVSLGYISEIERGQKEASSELLAALCAALDVPLSEILSEVSDAVALEETALGLRLESQLRPLDLAGDVAGGAVGSLPVVDPRAGDVVASAA